MKKLGVLFSAVYDWGQNVNGLLYFLRQQLIEYEYLMKITQSSIITIHRYLKTKLYKILSFIREDIVNYKPFYELEQLYSFIQSKDDKTVSEKFNNISLDKSDLANFHSIMNFYHKLEEYDKELSKILGENFQDDFKIIGGDQNKSSLLQQTNNYSLYLQTLDTYINNARGLNSTFEKVCFSSFLILIFYIFFISNRIK